MNEFDVTASQWTFHIDTQIINTQQELDLYGDIVFDVPWLLLQWVVTWALPEIYVDLIRKRRQKGLSTFIISSWYERDWVWLWNYESIVRNNDAWWIYLDGVNLKDITEVSESMHQFLVEWKQWNDLETAMVSRFWKNISDDTTNTAILEII